MKIIIDTPVPNPLYITDVPLQTTAESQAYFDAIPTSFASMTDTEKLTFNGFIKNLVNEELYSKLDDMYLYLPVLEGSEKFVNILNPSETLNFPSSGYATFDANGANAIKAWDTGVTLPRASRVVISHNTTTSTPTRTNVSIGVNNSTGWLGRRTGTGNSGYLFTSSVRAQFTGRTNAKGTLIAVNDALDEAPENHKTFAKDAETTKVVEHTFTDTPQSLVLFGATEGSTSTTPENSIGLHAWGKIPLTEAEADKAIELIDNFIDSLMG